jgi:oxygen-dependent protoporphyrinogen oxidase
LVAVIGGGISGLSAAHRLRRLLPGVELRLFESRSCLGGPLATTHRYGFAWEEGADSFTVKLPWARQLVTELGLEDELLPTEPRRRRALVVCRGKLLPVPEGFVLMRPQRLGGILRSRVLSLRGKLRLMMEPLIPVPPDAHSPEHDESVASFATRRLGREVYERLVQPLLGGIYVADAAQLSLAATMPEFLEAERQFGSLWRSPLGDTPSAASQVSRTSPTTDSGASLPPRPSPSEADRAQGARYHAFVSLRNGLSQLIEALAAEFSPGMIHLDTPVRHLAPTSDGRWIVTTTAPQIVDAVVLAVGAAEAGRLVASFDTSLATDLRGIPYASSAVVNLAYRPDQFREPPPGFGFVVPQIEGRPIVAASFPSVKFRHRDSPERTPVRVFVGGALQSEILEHDDGRLIQIAHDQLRELGLVTGAADPAFVRRWPQSMPQYHLGHLSRVDRIEQAVRGRSGLALAGNAYRGVGIPQCVASGYAAAQQVAEALQVSDSVAR